MYRGEVDALWTSRGGGGLPFLGNMTSSLLHPLTLLAAWLPTERVPLVQGLAVLTLSALFTFLFLRRLGVGLPSALCGALAFGFGGHQVLWLQYALSHSLLALPFCFWAVERLVEDRARRRVAVLALGFALLVLGGHPETTWISGLVAGLWALYRLWDAHGRWLVVGTALLGVGLSAVQWWPFLEYAVGSHGMVLRSLMAARDAASLSWGAVIVFSICLLFALALLRSAVPRGFTKRVLAILGVAVAVVMARRMGMALSGLVVLAPEMYGSPEQGGAYTGAEDFPGLNAAYAGVLPVLLLTVGALTGMGGGFVRFFAVGSALLWAAAFHMPALEGLVRSLPGLAEMGATRMLGPVGFLVACGGALILDELCDRATKPGFRSAAGRMGVTLVLGLALGAAVLKLPVDPAGGRTVVEGLVSPTVDQVHRGDGPLRLRFRIPGPVDDLRVSVDGRQLRHGPAVPRPDGEPLEVVWLAQRAEEGPHHVRVEAVRGGRLLVIASQPLLIRREHQLSARDVSALAAALAVALLIVAGRVRVAPWLAALAVGLDVAAFADGYNEASPRERLFPDTATTRFLASQEPPFRIFTEGTILPPDTQFAVGVDHLLSYDNIGLHRAHQWRMTVMDTDAFASFSFGRDNVAYASPRFDALDVRYVLTPRAADLSDIPGFELAHASEVAVWENTQNLGRAWVVGRAEVLAPDRQAELAALHPGEVALLDEPYEGPLGGRGRARVVEHTGASLRIEVEADGPALLVVAENRAPGWTASVDGGPAQPTLACDVTWQAVPVPAGAHEVRLVYDPPGYRRGRWISLASALLVLLMLLRPQRHA